MKTYEQQDVYDAIAAKIPSHVLSPDLGYPRVYSVTGLHGKGQYTIAMMDSREKAFDLVLNNRGDIYECWNSFVLVESIPLNSSLHLDPEESYWFVWARPEQEPLGQNATGGEMIRHLSEGRYVATPVPTKFDAEWVGVGFR